MKRFGKVLLGVFLLIAVLAALLAMLMRSPDLAVNEGDSVPAKMAALEKWHSELCLKQQHNGSILIAKKGRIVFHKHCGNLDIEGKKPITKSSSFNLASVSKQFTGMGIMLLAHEGKLAIDDPVSRWIPEIDAKNVTIRHLLHHTSGLADYMDLSESHWDTNKVLTYPDLLALFQKYRPEPHFLPGEKFEYSNTGYVLLALAVERASGLSYDVFMRENIFIPLKMNNSAAFNKLSKDGTLGERVFGFRSRYHLFGENVANDLTYLDGITGDGGIYASAADLFKWDRALSTGALLPAEVYAEALKSGRTNDGKETGYGFGWFNDKKGSYSHSGMWAGFLSAIIRDPNRQTLLVVLDSSTNQLRFQGFIIKLERFVNAL